MRHPSRNGIAVLIAGVALAIVSGLAARAGAQDVRPEITSGMSILPINDVEIRIQEDYFHGFRSIRDHEPGDLWQHGHLGLRWGVSDRVELEVDGALQKRFEAYSGRTDTGVGDFSVWGKFIMWQGTDTGTAVGFRLGIKMPNTPSNKDFGTNQTDFFAQILAGRPFGRLKTWGSVGLGILDQPYKLQSQDDIYTYCLAASYPLGSAWEISANGHGFFSHGQPVLYGDNHALTATLRYFPSRKWSLLAAAAKSSGRFYGDWSASLGATYRMHF